MTLYKNKLFCGENKRMQILKVPECCPSELQFKSFCCKCCEFSTSETENKKRSQCAFSICAKCDKATLERVEHKVKDYIISKVPPSSVCDRWYDTKQNEYRRSADLLWVNQDRVVQVEINKDESYNGRLGVISKWNLRKNDLCKPRCFIRFNPEGCQTEEEFNQRCDCLVSTIQQCLEGSNDLKMHRMYYSEDLKRHLRELDNELKHKSAITIQNWWNNIPYESDSDEEEVQVLWAGEYYSWQDFKIKYMKDCGCENMEFVKFNGQKTSR